MNKLIIVDRENDLTCFWSIMRLMGPCWVDIKYGDQRTPMTLFRSSGKLWIWDTWDRNWSLEKLEDFLTECERIRDKKPSLWSRIWNK